MSNIAPLHEKLLQTGVGAVTVSDPAAAAEAALGEALEYAAQKMKLPGPQSTIDHLRSGDGNAHGYFQYALARRVADYLAGFDEEVKAVYLYDYEATEEDVTFGELSALCPLHLIVLVRRKTEALSSLLAGLDRALAVLYADRLGLAGACHLLDAQVVDSGEVQRGTGYGAMLNSIHHRPMLIWER